MKYYCIRASKVKSIFLSQFKSTSDGVFTNYEDNFVNLKSTEIDKIAYLKDDYVGYATSEKDEFNLKYHLTSISSDFLNNNYSKSKLFKNTYYHLDEPIEFMLKKDGRVDLFGGKSIELDVFLNNYVLIDENSDMFIENWANLSEQIEFLISHSTDLQDVLFTYYRTLIDIFSRNTMFNNDRLIDFLKTKKMLSKPFVDKKFKLMSKTPITEADWVSLLVPIDNYLPFSNSVRLASLNKLSDEKFLNTKYNKFIDLVDDFISSSSPVLASTSKIFISEKENIFDEISPFELRLGSLGKKISLNQDEILKLKKQLSINNFNIYELDNLLFLFLYADDFSCLTIYPSDKYFYQIKI